MNDTPSSPDAEVLFTLLKGDRTGLTFNNQPELTPEFNVFNYMYFYNGGGLAAGDFNGDGLVDLYFTANQTDNRMYLNEGDLQFREVTDSAGVAGLPGWATGASVVDINQDGLLDIYVSQVSGYLTLEGRNQLYVCQGVENGVPLYKDEAAGYGLDLRGFGTQASFFDYDLDGDLDMYQLNHSLHQNGTFGKRPLKLDEASDLAGDKLLRNDGGKFTDVTTEAGIYSSVVGYGLGVATADVDNDGWPDIYVGNDFHENDYLYLNNQDGSFREVLTERMQHTSRFSMGVDIADINNDGHREIFSLDMLPEDPHILKSSLGEDGFDVFTFKLGFGYNPQFSRNTLQLNNGDGTFSEIGAFSGVNASDWSWGALFFDFDHDGLRDLFISNGIPRRMNDIDYINFKTNSELKFREEFNDIRDNELGFIDKMPEIKLKNKFYRNTGDLRFSDLSESVAEGAVSYSSSSVTVDLDNDGDLDVLTNNIEDAPFIYRNEAIRRGKAARASAGAWMQLKVTGPEGNLNGIGSSAIVFSGRERRVYDHFPVRGYQSSVQAPLHVAVGDLAAVDSVVIVFPNGQYRRLPLSDTGRLVEVAYGSDLPRLDVAGVASEPEPYIKVSEISDRVGINFNHTENEFVDFTREPLVPHMASAEGPAVAVGDVDGDGLEDVFLGSSKRESSALFLQTAGGSFQENTPTIISRDSTFEDVDAGLVDIDSDGHLDLVVAAGGNEYFAEQEPRTQRIYWGDGRGGFTEKTTLPGIYMTASRVLPGDANGDGLPDLLFTGRVVPKRYGQKPASYLLINQGNRMFADRTSELAPELTEAGMVKDGKWVDLDQDGDQDFVLAIEWAPITVFRQTDGVFKKEPIGEMTGWWNTVAVADLNGDGHLDLLAGNLGGNNKLRPTAAEPLRMYVNDFDDNGQPEQLLTYAVKGRRIPFASHAELMKQLPGLKKRYLFAQDMAGASLEEIFGADKLAAADVFEVNTLESVYHLSDGAGSYTTERLPARSQFSSINAVAEVVNGRAAGETAASSCWLVGGNFLRSNIEMGWYDAGFLHTLTFGQDGSATARALTGLAIGGVVRAIRPVIIDGRPAYLVVRNDDTLRVIELEEVSDLSR